MKAMKGNDFDKAYVSMMVNDHNNDIAKFENQSNNGTDADVKAFATATLPTLKKHKEKITEINEKMK
jgi:putative membrane protein